MFVSELAKIAVSLLVKEWQNFTPTGQHPSPSSITHNETSDLAAVVANRKPAAIICQPSLKGNWLVPVLVDAALENGFQVRESLDLTGQPILIVGQSSNVTTLQQLFNTVQNRPVTPLFHQQVGEALGYPPEAISNFLSKFRK